MLLWFEYKMPLYSKVKVGGWRLKGEETIISIALPFVEWRSETNFFIHTASPSLEINELSL